MKSSTASRLMCPPATWTCAGVSSSADQMCARTTIVPSSFFHAQATAVASPEKEASTPTARQGAWKSAFRRLHLNQWTPTQLGDARILRTSLRTLKGAYGTVRIGSCRRAATTPAAPLEIPPGDESNSRRPERYPAADHAGLPRGGASGQSRRECRCFVQASPRRGPRGRPSRRPVMRVWRWTSKWRHLVAQ